MVNWFGMGGYGYYVWSCYGLAIIILGLNVIEPLRRQNRIMNKLRKAQQDNEA